MLEHVYTVCVCVWVCVRACMCWEGHKQVCRGMGMGADEKYPDELWVINTFSAANQHHVSSPLTPAASPPQLVLDEH